jgi:hypothetical protein
LLGSLVLGSAAATAQILAAEPPPTAPEGAIMGPPTVEDAAMIAMASGMVAVEDVDRRFWDGNFEVEGTNAAGEDIEIIIDAQTGAIIDIDD